jgi:hypothetical protein
MRRLLASVAVLLVLVPAASGAADSGLYGRVMRGPVTPVCHVGRPCAVPASRVKLAFLQGSAVKGQVTTGPDGTYRIALPPGTYTVRGPPRLSPLSAVVPTGRWQQLSFAIDTGIR